MEWVAIDVNIAGDPAVHRIAAALRLKVPEAVGYLVQAFGGIAQHAEDGELGVVPDTLLEEWARWHGKRGAFAAQFRAELCEASGLVRSWEKYNGAKIRRLEAARERTRLWREKQELERLERDAAEREQSAVSTHTRTRHSTHTVSATYATTEQDRTEPNRKANNTSPSSSASEPEFDAEAELLNRLPTTVRRSWAAELQVAAQGMHGPPLTPDQIQQACRDYAGDGHLDAPKLAHFRGYLRNAATTPEKSPSSTPRASGDPFLKGLERWKDETDAKERASA